MEATRAARFSDFILKPFTGKGFTKKALLNTRAT